MYEKHVENIYIYIGVKYGWANHNDNNSKPISEVVNPKGLVSNSWAKNTISATPGFQEWNFHDSYYSIIKYIYLISNAFSQ